MENSRFRISKVSNRQAYEGLRGLWSSTFGDEAGYVDLFYKTFGEDVEFADSGNSRGKLFADDSEIAGFVVIDSDASEINVVAALTCFRCGVYLDKPVYVSYAVCTEPDYRGLGLASELVAHVRDMVLEVGGVSLVSPASERLIEFYEKLGYAPHFTASYSSALASSELPMMDIDDDELGCELVNIFGDPDTALDEDEIYEPELSVVACDNDVYNIYREAFLAEALHVEISEKLLNLLDGLYLINGGDAICAVTEITGSDESKKLQLAELIVNPMLLDTSYEIEEEIASRLAKHWNCELTEYRTLGCGICQGMIAGLASTLNEEQACNFAMPPYFGFPLD